MGNGLAKYCLFVQHTGIHHNGLTRSSSTAPQSPANCCRTMRSLALPLLALACWLGAPAPVNAQNTALTTKAPTMTHVATGEFTVNLKPLGPEGQPEDPKFGRMSINKTLSGGLVATTVGQMLTAGTAVQGSAGYVAIEKVDGVLDGKRGSFALQHTGTLTRGTPSLSVTVVPDSGTGELQGLTGEFKIIIAGGKHSYEFRYTLP